MGGVRASAGSIVLLSQLCASALVVTNCFRVAHHLTDALTSITLVHLGQAKPRSSQAIAAVRCVRYPIRQ